MDGKLIPQTEILQKIKNKERSREGSPLSNVGLRDSKESEISGSFFIAFFYPLCYIFVVKNRFYPFFTHGNKEKSRKPKKIKAFMILINAGGETVPPVFLCLAIPTQPPQNVSKIRVSEIFQAFSIYP